MNYRINVINVGLTTAFIAFVYLMVFGQELEDARIPMVVFMAFCLYRYTKFHERIKTASHQIWRYANTSVSIMAMMNLSYAIITPNKLNQIACLLFFVTGISMLFYNYRSYCRR